MKCIMAAFDPTCTEFSGKLTSDEDVEIDPSSHIRIKTKHHEVLYSLICIFCFGQQLANGL